MKTQFVGLSISALGLILMFSLQIQLHTWPFGITHALIVLAASVGTILLIVGLMFVFQLPRKIVFSVWMAVCLFLLFTASIAVFGHHVWLSHDRLFLRERLKGDAFRIVTSVSRYFVQHNDAEFCTLSDIWGKPGGVPIGTKERGAVYSPEVFGREENQYRIVITHPRLREPVVVELGRMPIHIPERPDLWR